MRAERRFDSYTQHHFMKYYLLALVLITILSWAIGKYLFESYVKEDIRSFERSIKESHPEYFKAPEAKRLGKSLQNSL